MHEMSLCEGMMQILEDQAAEKGFSRVKTVWLEVGCFSGVEIQALRFSFDVVAQGTLAEAAQLEILELPGQAWCMACGQTVEVTQRFDACPRCGGYHMEVTGGAELRVKELEVE